MKFILNKKDLVAFNQQFEQGYVRNESSLDFSISYAKKTENWTKALAWIVRAMLIDPIFEEGNTRTAALIIKTYAEHEGHFANSEKVVKLIKKILLKNLTSIQIIEDLIKDAIE
jgi:fido (protein-threonine AMPylation protein)